MAAIAAKIIDAALTLSTAQGCIVIVNDRSEVNLRWAGNNLTTNGQMHTRSVTVISTISVEAGPSGGATAAGVITRSLAGLDGIAELVRDSENAARSAGPADDAMPLISAITDQNFADEPATTDIAVFEQFAPALGRCFEQARSDSLLLYGFAEHIVTSQYLGTSTGLRRRFDQPTGRLEVNAKSSDLARSAWGGVQTLDFTDVDIEAVVAQLQQRLEWAKTRIDLPAGKYETVLPPTAVADLMIYAYWTASARDAEEGRTVFAADSTAADARAADARAADSGAADAGAADSTAADATANTAARAKTTRIGDRLSDLALTLRSDPREPGLECTPFVLASSSMAGVQSVFDNGAAITPTSWITDGVLTELMRSRGWAAHTDTEARPAIDNLVLDGGGTKTLDELIASTKRGLLLTCLWYIREVDPQTLLLTGLTRDGVYLIEDGKVLGAVNNFRFNESPVGLLGRITEVGRTEKTLPREWNDFFTRTAMPALRVADFNMSTVSQAS